MTQKSKSTGNATLIHVKTASNVAAFAQIENSILFGIASGAIKEGDQLPSVREQAENSSLNVNTIGKSYRDLEVMGVVSTRRGMGVYVAQGARKLAAKRVHEYLSSKISEASREARAAGWPSGRVLDIVTEAFDSNQAVY